MRQRAPQHAYIVVARFSDGTRRAAVCYDAEECRKFVSGEDQTTGEGPWATRLGRGQEERRTEVEYTTTTQLLDALRAAIA